MFDLPNIYKIEGRVPQKIRVKAIEEFIIYQNSNNKTVLAEIQKNKEFIADLYQMTDEYFARDFQGRMFLVGEINNDGDLALIDYFKLVRSE